jgi:hypothetical protein
MSSVIWRQQNARQLQNPSMRRFCTISVQDVSAETFSRNHMKFVQRFDERDGSHRRRLGDERAS